MQTIIDFWKRTVARDIAGFADKNSEVSVEQSGRLIAVRWQQREKPRHDVFEISTDGDFRWAVDSLTERVKYTDFLVSENMADFENLSKAIGRNFPAEPYYVPTMAEAEDGTGLAASDNFLLQQVESALSGGLGKTKLLFIKGEAGAGKTTLLRHITSHQADAYRAGTAKRLFLYVTAKGRALSNLRDAFAGETQDLRTSFTRDAIAPLTRHGLVVPIIDGFDELLGAAGYGDAFGSLQQFLDELDCPETVIT